MTSIIKYAKIAGIFAKGIFGLRKKEYRLQFEYVPEDKLWYIHMPWPGDRYNLAMVGGCDKLLDCLSDEEVPNWVIADVIPANSPAEHEGYFVCERKACRLTRGAFYDVHALDGFERDIWICPVTLCVLGHYPKYIYLKKVNPMDLLLATELSELELSLRTMKNLEELGLKTLRNLVECDYKVLVQRCRMSGITELTDLLDGLGLEFKNKPVR